jgi:hypothetical protein
MEPGGVGETSLLFGVLGEHLGSGPDRLRLESRVREESRGVAKERRTEISGGAREAPRLRGWVRSQADNRLLREELVVVRGSAEHAALPEGGASGRLSSGWLGGLTEVA